MTNVRDIMTPGADCARTDETIVQAAARMRDLGVGSLPICGDDNRLHGMLTDRDIVVRCVAQGTAPSTTVSEFAGTAPVTVGADDSLDEAIRTMTEHNVRRLPVIDGHDLVGMLSQADIARHGSEEQIAALVELISAAPANG